MTQTPLTNGKQYLERIALSRDNKVSIQDFNRVTTEDVWSQTRNNIERNIQREIEKRFNHWLPNFIVPNVDGTPSIDITDPDDGLKVDISSGSGYIRGRLCTIPAAQQHVMTNADGDYYLALHILNYGADESFELIDFLKTAWAGMSNKENYILLADITVSGTGTEVTINKKLNLQGRPNSLPIGAILMYDGTGIANAATRTQELGIVAGDEFTMPGWYVCNGQSSTPNLIDKFIRSESTSGNTGGEDTHVLTENEMPAHDHEYGALVAITAVGGAVELIGHGSTYDTTSKGGGAAHENKPSFYSLIFIIRKN